MDFILSLFSSLVSFIIWIVVIVIAVNKMKGKSTGTSIKNIKGLMQKQKTIQQKQVKKKSTSANRQVTKASNLRGVTTSDDMLRYSKKTSNVHELEKENWVRD